MSECEARQATQNVAPATSVNKPVNKPPRSYADVGLWGMTARFREIVSNGVDRPFILVPGCLRNSRTILQIDHDDNAPILADNVSFEEINGELIFSADRLIRDERTAPFLDLYDAHRY